MNCDEYRAAYLSDTRGEPHRAHVSGCPYCRAAEERLAELKRVLHDPVMWEEPPDVTGDQVVAAVERSPRGGSARTITTWLAAAAAVLVVAVGLAALLTRNPPDWEVVMVGTDLAPEARVTVFGWNTDSGTRMVLASDNFSDAPTGSYYEFWLSSETEIVSAGTFQAADGVELWAAAHRSQLPHLWVTVEEIDGDPLPSGFTILDAP